MKRATVFAMCRAISALAITIVGCSEPFGLEEKKDHPSPPAWSVDASGVTCEGDGVRVVATSTTDHIAITCSWPCGAHVDFYAQPHVQFFALLEEGCP